MIEYLRSSSSVAYLMIYGFSSGGETACLLACSSKNLLCSALRVNLDFHFVDCVPALAVGWSLDFVLDLALAMTGL